MAWTAPRTWVAGETVTAALLNTHLRDNLKAATEYATTWTPSWTASTTNPTLGNGTLTGRFVNAGKKCDLYFEIVFGTTTTAGTGTWMIDLPVTEVSRWWMLKGVARDDSGSSSYDVSGDRVAASTVNLRCDPTTAGNALRAVNSTAPFTWANLDRFFGTGTVEAA